MSRPAIALAILGAAIGITLSTAAMAANDDMFPPAPAARPFIDFDGEGFIVNGQREFIASGSIQFLRDCRALIKLFCRD